MSPPSKESHCGDDDLQDTNADSVVEETQYQELESDTQATDRFVGKPEKVIPRPESDTLEKIYEATNFKFGVHDKGVKNAGNAPAPAKGKFSAPAEEPQSVLLIRGERGRIFEGAHEPKASELLPTRDTPENSRKSGIQAQNMAFPNRNVTSSHQIAPKDLRPAHESVQMQVVPLDNIAGIAKLSRLPSSDVARENTSLQAPLQESAVQKLNGRGHNQQIQIDKGIPFPRQHSRQNHPPGRPILGTRASQVSPHRMAERPRGIVKATSSKTPNGMKTSKHKATSQVGEVQDTVTPRATHILHMAVLAQQKEQVELETAEIHIKEQQEKLGRLKSDNSALQQQITSLQEAEHLLGTEHNKLREEYNQCKAHVDSLTESQKILEKSLLKSNEKHDLLLEKMEQRDQTSAKEIENARRQVETFESTLAEKIDQGTKDARHEVELMQGVRESLEKDLERKNLELAHGRERVDWLEKEKIERAPNNEPLVKKLEEHFEGMRQQLSAYEEKKTSMARSEETTINTKVDECLNIMNALKDKEVPQPLALTKMIESLTRIESRLSSGEKAEVNLREAENVLLRNLKGSIEAMQTDRKAQQNLDEQIVVLREANTGLTEKGHARDATNSELEHQISTLNREFQATKEELAALRALRAEIPLLQNQNEDLRTTNAGLKAQMVTIAQDAIAAKEELDLQRQITESEQAKLLRFETLVRGFNNEKSKYERMKNDEAIVLRKELEQTLTRKLEECDLQHRNAEKGIKRANSELQKKLDTALVDLARFEASCQAASSESTRLRASLETEETERRKLTADIRRLEERLQSDDERCGSASTDLQSIRDGISDCKRFVVEGKKQAEQSADLLDKVRDAVSQHLRFTEETTGTSSMSKQVFISAPPTSSQNAQSRRSSHVPRVAQRNASSQSTFESPVHLSELDSFVHTKRRQIIKVSYHRPNETYEIRQSTPVKMASSAILTQTPLLAAGALEEDLQLEQVSSPAFETQLVFSDNRVPDTQRGMEKEAEQRRSTKAKIKFDEPTIRVQKENPSPSKEDENAQRRQKQPAKSSLKRRRATQGSTASSQDAAVVEDSVLSKPPSNGPANSASRQMNRHFSFGTSNYCRIASATSETTREQQTARAGSLTSGLSRSLSGSATRMPGVDDDENHPPKVQKVSRSGRGSSKPYLPVSQSDSQFSTYVPSQS